MLEKLFRDFVGYMEEKKIPMEAVAVGDERKVRAEHHFTADQPRNIYSHTKSYVSTAAGIAIADGKLSLDDRVADFFPEKVPAGAQPELSEIRLRHLLTMSSGFHHPYLMGPDRRSGTGAPDYLGYMLSRPVEVTPGSEFTYSSGDSILAGRMIEKAVGQRLGAYMYERIFRPLGQGYPLWEHGPEGHAIGGGGMHMTLTNMMKLGQLYLADGVWDGQRLVEHDWIVEATKKQIETPVPAGKTDFWKVGYGYQFWMSPYPDAYRADGAFGQITTVLPSCGLVVAMQCPESGDVKASIRALHEHLIVPLVNGEG